MKQYCNGLTFSLTVSFGLYLEFRDWILLRGLDCNDPYSNYCTSTLILSNNYVIVCLILSLVWILEHLSLGAFWSFLPVWLKFDWKWVLRFLYCWMHFNKKNDISCFYFCRICDYLRVIAILVSGTYVLRACTSPII